MVCIVLEALSGAKIAHREKARMISEEVISTCQLTFGPLRSVRLGPSLSNSALVLGGRLFSRSTSTLLRWLPPIFPYPPLVWNGRAQGCCCHATQPCIHTLFPCSVINEITHATKSCSLIRRQGSRSKAYKDCHVNALIA